MLAVAPVLLLLLAAILTWFLALIKLRPGSIWLITALMTTAAWGVTLVLGVISPEPLIISDWLPRPHNFTGLVFSWHAQNWAIGFMVITLITAIIFSEAKYLDSADYIRKISGSLFLGAFALLAVMAGTPLSFVIAWSLIDLIEFGAFFVSIGEERSLISAATSMLFRGIGIFLLLFLTSVIPANVFQSNKVVFTTPLWVMIIFMVLFRTGILPLFQPFQKSPAYQRGIVTILRLVPLASTFAFIQYILSIGQPVQLSGVWLIVITIAILWGAVSWFAAKNELLGRSYFLFAMAGFGLAALLTATPDALPALAAILISAGAGLFLYSPRLKRINPFLIIVGLSLLTIPFTPSASLSSLFVGDSPFMIRLLWCIGFSFLVAGWFKHSLKRIEDTTQLEPWMFLFHSIALYFIALAPWVLVVVFLPQQNQFLLWWPWITILVLSALIVGIPFAFRSRFGVVRSQHRNIVEIGERITGIMVSFLKFNWLSRILASLGFVIDRIVNSLARVMEGDGGILWSFLFIALLLSLLFTRQMP